jgi:hypothetical protein
LGKVRELQNKANREFQKRLKDHKIQLSLWEQKLKKDRGIRPEKPVPRENFYVTNATLEGINRNLHENIFGMIYAPDELNVLLGGLDAYRATGSKKDMAELNSFFYNKASVTLRADDDRNTSSPHPFVGILGGIQPEELQRFVLANPSFFSTGFASRCLFIQPKDDVIDVCDDDDMKEIGNEIYDYIIEYLWEQRRTHKFKIETGQEKIAPNNPVVLTFDTDAIQRYKDFRKIYITQMNGMSSSETAAIGRLLEYCARIALVFHVTEWLGSDHNSADFTEWSGGHQDDNVFAGFGKDISKVPKKISVEIVESAIAITEWLMHQNQIVMQNMAGHIAENKPPFVENEIIDVIQKLGDNATLSQIRRQKRKWNTDQGKQELEISLAGLVDDGSLEYRTVELSNGNTKVIYVKKVQ